MADRASLTPTPVGVAGASSVAATPATPPLKTSLLRHGLETITSQADKAIISEAVIDGEGTGTHRCGYTRHRRRYVASRWLG